MFALISFKSEMSNQNRTFFLNYNPTFCFHLKPAFRRNWWCGQDHALKYFSEEVS